MIGNVLTYVDFIKTCIDSDVSTFRFFNWFIFQEFVLFCHQIIFKRCFNEIFIQFYQFFLECLYFLSQVFNLFFFVIEQIFMLFQLYLGKFILETCTLQLRHLLLNTFFLNSHNLFVCLYLLFIDSAPSLRPAFKKYECYVFFTQITILSNCLFQFRFLLQSLLHVPLHLILEQHSLLVILVQYFFNP